MNTFSKLVLVACAVSVMLGSQSFSETLKTGPKFVLKDVSGKTISSKSFKGKIVVLNFWATWCPPCVGEIPYLVALQKKYEKQGVQVVGVSMDEDQSGVPAFVKAHSMGFPVLYATPKLQKDLGGIRSIPTTYILDRNFKIVEKLMGYHDLEGFEKVIVPLLKK
ncbi:MAG: TlpA family protein disulfide reductase [Candidatus Margulisbacteria bacterium]|nr:TlpA family protein disulfide reductase [Candidatus Margulisiibacteriota bacterium]